MQDPYTFQLRSNKYEAFNVNVPFTWSDNLLRYLQTEDHFVKEKLRQLVKPWNFRHALLNDLWFSLPRICKGQYATRHTPASPTTGQCIMSSSSATASVVRIY
jgi:hypothetical protein